MEEIKWQDAADKYILEQELQGENILVIDDHFGALSCNLKGNITTVSDSVKDIEIIKDRLYKINKEVKLILGLDDLPQGIDTVIIRLPKYIDLLEYYLQIIGNTYPGVRVIIGGMVKYMPISMVRLTEKYFINVTTSLAKKKARLIFGIADNKKKSLAIFPSEYKLDNGLKVIAYPGTFSSKHLDIGTRFLIEHIPKNRKATIMDLGCGNGVIGLMAKKLNPDSTVILTDNSFLGVKSARETFGKNNLEGIFKVMDVLKGHESDCVDIVLCNPPFHQGNYVSRDVAIKMFKESRRILKRGGTLFVVTNKHLGYHKKLRTIFHNLHRVAENKKFFVYSVRKV